MVGPNVRLWDDWKRRLSHTHWEIREALSGAEALEKLIEAGSELMLLDPKLPDLEPNEFEALVRAQYPGIQIITLAAQDSPFQPSSVSTTSFPHTGQQHSRVTLRAETAPHRDQLSAEQASATDRGWHELVGGSGPMQRVYRSARLVARRDTTVLIQGESGTGKDLLARAIHVSSARDKQPLVIINCAAIPEALLEAELFGYTKGAFTGAAQSRIGRIHAAHGGTLFLDEIGDMPFPLQSKILRFLEQGEVQRLGGTDTLKVDCRVIAATNADLLGLVKARQFREDLYYRLAIFPIALPPLRERMVDLELLVTVFVRRFCPGAQVAPAAMQMLLAHQWPGNVRELRNVIERASLYADGRSRIEPDDIVL